MFLPKEERTTLYGFPQLIDYFGLVDDGIAFLRSGRFLAAWEYTGPDMDSASVEERFAHSVRLASGIDLGANFGVGSDFIREPSLSYPASSLGDWPDPVSFTIDQDRKQQFTKPGNYWRNRYFFYVTYGPQTQASRRKLQSWFFEEREGDDDGFAARALSRFERAVEQIDSLLRSSMVNARRLRCYKQDGQLFDELLRYSRYCAFGQDDPFPLPDEAVFLHELFAADFVAGADPILNGKHKATVAINGFPVSSFAGILSNSLALPFPYRFCQQTEILGRQQAVDLHDGNAKGWSAKKTNFLRKHFKKDETIVDPHAAQLEAEANQAKTDADYRKVVDCLYTGKVILSGDSRAEVNEQAREVIEALRPFTSRLEKQNAAAAFISSLPGQMYKDKRQNVVSTLNLAHFLPVSSPFLGLEYNPSSDMFPPRTPPLFLASTAGGTKFRYHAHTDKDVAHMVIAGPTGKGKTTFLNLGIAQWFRYPEAQVFAFDKKKLLYTLTRAMGGDYYDLGMGNKSKLRFCPLRFIETAAEREEALTWLTICCEQNGLHITASHTNAISEALEHMTATRQRSLTDFWLIVDHPEVKEAIEYYTVKGASGGLLDGTEDNLSLSRFSVFEMDEIYNFSPKLMNAVMLYIFRRINKRLSPNIPTLVTIDEFRKALEVPVMVSAVDNLLNEGRKLNTAFWLSLQDLKVLERGPAASDNLSLGSTIKQCCLTKVFLPNPLAATSARKPYEDCGLTDSDIDIISQAQSKREYFVCNQEGQRKISLDIGRVALAFFASTDEDRATVDRMIERNPGSWQADWLRHKGLSASGWPDFLGQLYAPEMQEQLQHAKACA